MTNSKVLRTAEEVIDIKLLIRRQDNLEEEVKYLRSLYSSLADSHKTETSRIYKRISMLERELVDLRATINEMKDSVDSVYSSVVIVEKHVSEINVKQDVAIQAQDKFITQLWKAFFALLGIITAAGAAILTFN